MAVHLQQWPLDFQADTVITVEQVLAPVALEVFLRERPCISWNFCLRLHLCVFSSGVPATVNSNYGAYSFAGFYALPTTGSLLDGRVTTGSGTTLESCASFCQGTPFFALEQGKLLLTKLVLLCLPFSLTPGERLDTDPCQATNAYVVAPHLLPRPLSIQVR